jgi:hypothetical protein
MAVLGLVLLGSCSSPTATPNPLAISPTLTATTTPTPDTTAAAEATHQAMLDINKTQTAAYSATSAAKRTATSQAPPPTVTPAPSKTTPPSSGASLPAPVYFINTEDSQIWRVETDGVSLTQITSEDAPVTDFDVSPKDGALVYVSDDQLIYYTSALGGQRQILMPAGEFYEQNQGLSVINSAVRRPLWSPDGNRIAYAQGGINLHLDPAEPPQPGVPEVWSVLANDPLPDPLPDEDAVYEFEGPQTWYRPLSWLPDGQRILVSARYYGALGGFMGILDVEDGSLVEIALPQEAPCCDRAWGQESHHLLQSGRLPGMNNTGLWRIDPSTGEHVVLIPGETGDEVHLFAYPIEVGGRVYGFHTSAQSQGVMPHPLQPMAMVGVANDGSAEFDQLSQDYWVVGGADWLPDGSGVVITDVAGIPDAWTNSDGVLRWLASDGSPAVTLPAKGQQPQWGYKPDEVSGVLVYGVLVHYADIQTGLDEVDQIIDIVLAGDMTEFRKKVKFTTSGCTHVMALGGPVNCREGEAEGTPVEVLPFLGAGEGSQVRRDDLNNWQGIDAAGLYAVYRVSGEAYSSKDYPTGEYGIAFRTKDPHTIVTLQVENGSILRVDSTFIPPNDNNLNIPPEVNFERDAQEIILTPPITDTGCPGAPPQRVAIDEQARVCTEAEDLIVRKGPGLDGMQLIGIETGTDFMIIDGPACANNWFWWKVELDSGLEGWIAEGGDNIDPYFICPVD